MIMVMIGLVFVVNGPYLALFNFFQDFCSNVITGLYIHIKGNISVVHR